jgi:uncharacterized membrane protein (UPF0127 family)
MMSFDQPRTTGDYLRQTAMREVMPVLAAPVFRCLRNQTRGTVLCARATLARGFRGRSRGLLGRRQLSPDEGMLFEAKLVRLMWMHTFFMTFPIDIVFLDRGEVVINVQSSLKPWRLSPIVFGAHKAIELVAGAAVSTGTAVGDLILFTEVQNSGESSLCMP